MTIFPKGVLCNQSSVRPIRRAQMNNLTLNKGKIYSPQAWVQYRRSSRWRSSICGFHGPICPRLRRLRPLCSSLFQFLPFFFPPWCSLGRSSNASSYHRIAHFSRRFPPNFMSRLEFYYYMETFLRGRAALEAAVVLTQKYHRFQTHNRKPLWGQLC